MSSIVSKGPTLKAQTKRRGIRAWFWGLLIVVSVIVGAIFGFRIRQQSIIHSLSESCQKFSKNADWPALEKAARQWSTMEPQVAEPWLFWAEAAEGEKDWMTVADCLGHVPDSDRRVVPALVRKMELEFGTLNRPWHGLNTCDQIIAIEPRVLLAHKQSCFFCAMTLQRSELIRRVRRAIRVRRESPSSYVYLISANWFYGSSLYRHNTFWLQNDPDNETFRVAQAMQIYMSEAKTNLEEASKYEHIPPAEELLRKYPHNIELLAYLIDLAMEDGDVERVMGFLAQVPSKPASSDARFLRAQGWLADSEGDLKRASELLLQAFVNDPYWWKLHFQLQDVLRRSGDTAQADHFMEAYEIGSLLHKKIVEMNTTGESFDDADFRLPLLKLAELVGDGEVVTALHERLAIK